MHIFYARAYSTRLGISTVVGSSNCLVAVAAAATITAAVQNNVIGDGWKEEAATRIDRR